jgi:hypothetical protein
MFHDEIETCCVTPERIEGYEDVIPFLDTINKDLRRSYEELKKLKSKEPLQECDTCDDVLATMHDEVLPPLDALLDRIKERTEEMRQEYESWTRRAR